MSPIICLLIASLLSQYFNKTFKSLSADAVELQATSTRHLQLPSSVTGSFKDGVKTIHYSSGNWKDIIGGWNLGQSYYHFNPFGDWSISNAVVANPFSVGSLHVGGANIAVEGQNLNGHTHIIIGGNIGANADVKGIILSNQHVDPNGFIKGSWGITALTKESVPSFSGSASVSVSGSGGQSVQVVIPVERPSIPSIIWDGSESSTHLLLLTVNNVLQSNMVNVITYLLQTPAITANIQVYRILQDLQIKLMLRQVSVQCLLPKLNQLFHLPLHDQFLFAIDSLSSAVSGDMQVQLQYVTNYFQQTNILSLLLGNNIPGITGGLDLNWVAPLLNRPTGYPPGNIKNFAAEVLKEFLLQIQQGTFNTAASIETIKYKIYLFLISYPCHDVNVALKIRNLASYLYALRDKVWLALLQQLSGLQFVNMEQTFQAILKIIIQSNVIPEQLMSFIKIILESTEISGHVPATGPVGMPPLYPPSFLPGQQVHPSPPQPSSPSNPANPIQPVYPPLTPSFPSQPVMQPHPPEPVRPPQLPPKIPIGPLTKPCTHDDIVNPWQMLPQCEGTGECYVIEQIRQFLQTQTIYKFIQKLNLNISFYPTKAELLLYILQQISKNMQIPAEKYEHIQDLIEYLNFVKQGISSITLVTNLGDISNPDKLIPQCTGSKYCIIMNKLKEIFDNSHIIRFIHSLGSNPSHFHTRLDYIKFILEKLVHSNMIPTDYLQHISYYLDLISEAILGVSSIKSLPTLIGNLLHPQNKQEEGLFNPLFNWISHKENAMNILAGMNIPLSITAGQFLRIILQKALSLVKVQQNSQLYQAITYFINRIPTSTSTININDILQEYSQHLTGVTNGGIVVISGGSDKEVQTQQHNINTVITSTVNLNDILRAVDFSQLGQKHARLLMLYFAQEFDPQIMSNGFQFWKYKTKGEWLKALVEFLLNNGSLSRESWEVLSYVLPFIRLTGVGAEPL